MKKNLILLVTLLIFSFNRSIAQRTPPDGYMLKWVQNIVPVYTVDPKDSSSRTRYRVWNHQYWFYKAGIVRGNDKVEFVKLWLPDSAKGAIIDTNTNFNNGADLDTSNFNKWLYVRRSTVDSLQYDHYPKTTWGFVSSILTVPFKIRPKVGDRETSLYNSNFNVGDFFGLRVGILNNDIGITVGGTLGVSTQEQTAAVNTALTGTTSQNMAALNYGLGIMLDVWKNTQIGFVAGRDSGFGDLKKTYVYQNKTWFAFSLSFNFFDGSKASRTQSQN